MNRALVAFGLFAASSTIFACAAKTSDASATDDDEELRTATNATVSAKLDGELFDANDDADGTKYVLVGHLPSSQERCSVTLRRSGLHPSPNNWSTITIHALGKSADTLEEHGPIDMGYAYPAGGSSDKQAITITGNDLTYSETEKELNPQRTHNVLNLSLSFSASAHHWDKLTSASIKGDDFVAHREESCEGLVVGITLKGAELAKVKQAKTAWGTANHEDVSSLDFEGCEVSSPTRLACEFGNETNEEQLELIFELANGHVGNVVHADRRSDF